MKLRNGLRVDADTSERMARIRQAGTDPELCMRRLATELGLRYRLTNRDLPGSPDLANRSQRWAIFVHGCFWHGHHGCKKATVPKRNRAFWVEKFAANRTRDRRAIRALRKLGYVAVVVWQCELARPQRVLSRLRTNLLEAPA